MRNYWPALIAGVVYTLIVAVGIIYEWRKSRATKNRGITLTITPNDIYGAMEHSKTSCPIARAILRQFDTGRFRPTVDGTHIRFWDSKDVCYSLVHTSRTKKFVRDFDKGKNVRPTVFRLPPLDWWSNWGVVKGDGNPNFNDER